MNSIVNITYLIFILTEIILNRLFRSKQNDQQDADKRSIVLLWVTIVLSTTLAGFVAGYTSFPVFSNEVRIYLGVGVIYIGILLRLAAVYTLGKFFTVDVTIREGHRLKKDGLFKYIRHPNYAALLISFFGMGITDNNWLSLGILFIPILIVFIVRINIEEQVLAQHFGAEYTAYEEATKRLIPFVY
jgi:protein-S-isoprenylcysteine O-methyltransferase Ste14